MFSVGDHNRQYLPDHVGFSLCSVWEIITISTYWPCGILTMFSVGDHNHQYLLDHVGFSLCSVWGIATISTYRTMWDSHYVQCGGSQPSVLTGPCGILTMFSVGDHNRQYLLDHVGFSLCSVWGIITISTYWTMWDSHYVQCGGS